MSSQQISLNFSGRLSPEVQEAMGRCYANADPYWKPLVYACVVAVARRKAELTSDDVLAELDAINAIRKELNQPLYETHNLRAIGPAMQQAAKNGIIEATDQMVRSDRAGKHGNNHRVWSSKVHIQRGSGGGQTPDKSGEGAPVNGRRALDVPARPLRRER